jgi:PAS domain S-box-containing protein
MLDALLEANPTAVVAALAAEGGLVPLPRSLSLRGQQQAIESGTAIDAIVPEDQVRVIDGWRRAAEEPVVCVDVRFLADPESPVRLHFVDVREAHGAHVVVLEVDDPGVALRSIEARAGQRRRAAHIQRDALGVILAADHATSELLGWTEAELCGRQSVDLVQPEDVERALESWMAMRSGAGSPRVRARYRHAAGHHVWLEVTNDNRLDDPAVGRVLSELVDVTEECPSWRTCGPASDSWPAWPRPSPSVCARSEPTAWWRTPTPP